MKNYFTPTTRTLSLLASLALLSGCASLPQPVTNRNSILTQGNIEMNLKVGHTTKADVLEKFGSPNVVTRDGSRCETWTYQRAAQASQSSAATNFWTLLLVSQSKNNSGFESTSRMITLIIKFDRNDIVADFNSRTSNF